MNKIASKIFNIIGIMYRHMVPFAIRLTIYNGLIKSHLIYGLKCWGFNQDRILKLQKKHANYMFECLPLSQRAAL